MPVKTLHLTNSYHPSSGGIRTFYTALLEAANRSERYVRLVVPAEANRVEDVGRFGRIYHVVAPCSPWFDRRYRLILPHRFLLPVNTVLRRIIQREQPDLVEICDKFSLCWLAGALRKSWIRGVRRPVIVGLSCERLDDNVAAYLSASRSAARLTSTYMTDAYGRLFDHHIAVSGYVAEELRLLGDGPRADGRSPFVQVLPHGVDAEGLGPQFRSEQTRADLLRRYGCGGDGALLLYAGRLSREKNLPLLIDMMERLLAPPRSHQSGARDYRLLVAGSGPLRPWLEAESARRAPGHVHFLGQIGDRKALAVLLANSDVFVHPNPREPFGIAPLEAMASGLPLVAPAAGGVLTYANHENAWLAEPSGDAFASAVRAILGDAAAARRKAERARETAAQHNWRRVTARYFDAYDRLCRTGADRRTSAADVEACEVEVRRAGASSSARPEELIERGRGAES